MRAKSIITGLLTALFFVSISGVAISEVFYDEDVFLPASSTSMSLSHERPDAAVNWLAISATPSELDLTDTYEYQLNRDKYTKHDNMNVEQIEPSEREPCIVAANFVSEKCREFRGG